MKEQFEKWVMVASSGNADLTLNIHGEYDSPETSGFYELYKLARVDISQALTDMAVQLANAESKCRELAAENAGLKSFGDKLDEMHNDLNGEGTGIQGRAEVACQQVALEAAMEEFEAIKTPATDAFLAEVRAQGVTEYASKRGFSFQHGSIHAHFGNGDVMVGSVTFENGDAGINFAPVREKTGGVGTHYDWTKGKTAEQVDSIFVIASSNAEGLEVIRDKLSEAIAKLRKGSAL